MKMLWKKFNYCNIFKRSAFSKTSVRIIFLQKMKIRKIHLKRSKQNKGDVPIYQIKQNLETWIKLNWNNNFSFCIFLVLEFPEKYII